MRLPTAAELAASLGVTRSVIFDCVKRAGVYISVAEMDTSRTEGGTVCGESSAHVGVAWRSWAAAPVLARKSSRVRHSKRANVGRKS